MKSAYTSSLRSVASLRSAVIHHPPRKRSAFLTISPRVAALQLPFPEARLCVIGAGNTTRLLITHLASRGLQRISIVNRSYPRPRELAEQVPDVEFEIVLEEVRNCLGAKRRAGNERRAGNKLSLQLQLRY